MNLMDENQFFNMTKSSIRRIHVDMDATHVLYLNAILDSYEGIGMMRTADEKAGKILIYTSENHLEDVKMLINALNSEGILIKVTEIDSIDEVY